MKTKILISLLALVAVAGCTVPGIPGITTITTIAGVKGLEITSFTAEPNTVYTGNTVRVLMETQNQGGSTAYNASSFAYLTGSNMNLSGSSGGMYWTGKDLADKTECQYFLKDMKPADVVRGTEGDTKLFKWNLVAPNVTAGQTRNDIFIGRVYTDYETGVNGNVWIYTEAEADAAKASGRALNKGTFSSTSGPIGVEVSVSPDPVIIYGTDKSLTLNIKISNLAAGTIYKSGVVKNCNVTLTTDDLNRVKVTVTAPDLNLTGTDCATADKEQELVAGRPTTVFCDVTIKGDVTTFKSVPINVKVKYGYFTERTASVTVQGK